MKFKEYKGLDLAGIAADVLGEWDARDTFHKSITTREGHPTFVFYEGPPSANGMPGIHHVMARTIKDVFCRYKTQQGYLVHRKAGWDTHGLPVELGVEKKLGITKEDIGKKISIEEYNRTCREAVMEFTGKWEDLTRKMGYWVNMDDPYITYDNKYIETLWWLLKQLFDKGLLYKGYTIQPYSPAAGTGLSTHELNQPGCYRDVKDTTCTSQFRVIRDAKSEKLFEGIEGELYFLAWTTTPWTLPSNAALAVGPAIEYVKVKCRNPYTDRPQTVILAKELLGSYFTKKMEGTYEIMEGSWKGPELEGIRYEQLIPWEKTEGDAFRVIVGDYVTTSDGTGIVHIAPTFGADDDRVAKAAGIPPLFMVDRAGKNQPMVDRQGKFFLIEDLDPEFVKTHVDAAKYGEYAGRYVKNAYDERLSETDPTLDIDIAVMLKAENKAFKIEKHTHSYPHCWRTDKPVLYYPLDSWFIRTTALRERMIELNKTIRWKPESTGTGRFGKWLEGLVDWNLSRSRFWGTPLPVWATEDYSEVKCIGSVEELMAEIERSIAAGVMQENPYRNFRVGDMSKENYSTENIDLHRPYVDSIVLVSSKGEPMRRESDLIDVWFDSGAMPYAQVHYPFENKEGFGQVYPADFIAEGVDQTRGWFFTLHAIASMLFDSVAFKNIISNGLVLDKNGNKMSKRLGNAVDPFEVLDTYGADATRWYMISNSQPWDNLKFDRDGVDEVRRKFFGTLYNTYSFFALYANVDGFTGREEEVPMEKRPEIDRWIISLLNTLVKNVTESLEDYDPTPAARAIQEFVGENLSNWYVRLNRKRFWGGGMSEDKLAAYQTLYTCLETVTMLAAPFAPFISDRIFTDLNAVSGRHKDESVHLAAFPPATSSLRRPPRRDDVAGAEGLVDGAGPAPQSVDQGAPAADQNPDPGARPRDGGAYFGREEPHYERGQREGDRADRKDHGADYQTHQAQLQDPRAALRQVDEADRRPRRGVLAGTYRRGGGRAGNGARPRSGADHRDARRLRDHLGRHARMARRLGGKTHRGARHYRHRGAESRRCGTRVDKPHPEYPQGLRIRGHGQDPRRDRTEAPGGRRNRPIRRLHRFADPRRGGPSGSGTGRRNSRRNRRGRRTAAHRRDADIAP